MNSILRKGLCMVTVTGILTVFPIAVHAADTKDTQISTKEQIEETKKGEYSDMAFADVHSFLYIRSEPTIQSEWVGKLYPDYAAKIIGPVGE